MCDWPSKSDIWHLSFVDVPYRIHDIILPVCLRSFQKSFQFCLSPLPHYNRQSDNLLPQPQSVPNYGVFALSPLRERNFGPMPPKNHTVALLWSPNKDEPLTWFMRHTEVTVIFCASALLALFQLQNTPFFLPQDICTDALPMSGTPFAPHPCPSQIALLLHSSLPSYRLYTVWPGWFSFFHVFFCRSYNRCSYRAVFWFLV